MNKQLTAETLFMTEEFWKLPTWVGPTTFYVSSCHYVTMANDLETSNSDIMMIIYLNLIDC